MDDEGMCYDDDEDEALDEEFSADLEWEQRYYDDGNDDDDDND